MLFSKLGFQNCTNGSLLVSILEEFNKIGLKFLKDFIGKIEGDIIFDESYFVQIRSLGISLLKAIISFDSYGSCVVIILLDMPNFSVD